MPQALKLTKALLQPYFFGKKKHSGYEQTVKEYKTLKVHVEGEYPKEIIDERRPNELDAIKDYRKKIYEPITYDTVHKVISSLQKIRRTTDWNIDFRLDQYPSTVSEEERLDAFVTDNFPVTDTYENWLFTILFKDYITDPNSVVLVKPLNENVESTEYIKPFPFIFNSPQIYEFIPNELLIVCLDEDVQEMKYGKPYIAPKKFLVVNTETMVRYVQDKEGKYVSEWEYEHNLGILPAFKTKGMYHKMEGRNSIFRSRIYPMVPRLNDAAREYSDLQAEVVLHMHSERWAWASEKCDECSDAHGIPTGFVRGSKKESKITCPKCGGSKLKSSTPYTTMVVRPTKQNMGEQPTPIPPAGYITKDTKMVEVQNSRINGHLDKALGSINMEFLSQTPLAESGVAKEVDRDELNNFVYSIAEDLVRISDNYFMLSVEYRYRIAVPSYAKRKALRPEQKTPEKFDLLTSNYLAKEIGEIKEAGINSVISSTLEIEYAGKKFYNDPMVREKVRAILILDPLNGLSEDEKMVRFQTNGISRLTYVTSSNISSLVDTAIEEYEAKGKKSFLKLDVDEKRKVIEKLARKLMSEIDQEGINMPGSEDKMDEGETGETFQDLPVHRGEKGDYFVYKGDKRQYLKKDENGNLQMVKEPEQ